MLLEKSPKIITGIFALLIYFILLGLLIFYFNTKEIEKPKHYVKKNENRIQVSISTAKTYTKPKTLEKVKKENKIKEKIKPKKTKEKIKPKKIKEKVKPKKSVKKKENKKITKDKVVKKRIKKQKKRVNKMSKKTTKSNKVKEKHKADTSDLFSNVKTKNNVHPKIKAATKEKITKKRTASDKIRDSLKKESKKDKGVENAYFSKVQSLLETWPAQSEFAGEKAIVRISVMPTGKFEFNVQTLSNNIMFNQELIAFLKQLQGIGLGRHHAGRNYEFDVEFIAKE